MWKVHIGDCNSCSCDYILEKKSIFGFSFMLEFCFPDRQIMDAETAKFPSSLLSAPQKSKLVRGNWYQSIQICIVKLRFWIEAKIRTPDFVRALFAELLLLRQKKKYFAGNEICDHSELLRLERTDLASEAKRTFFTRKLKVIHP